MSISQRFPRGAKLAALAGLGLMLTAAPAAAQGTVAIGIAGSGGWQRATSGAVTYQDTLQVANGETRAFRLGDLFSFPAPYAQSNCGLNVTISAIAVRADRAGSENRLGGSIEFTAAGGLGTDRNGTVQSGSGGAAVSVSGAADSVIRISSSVEGSYLYQVQALGAGSSGGCPAASFTAGGEANPTIYAVTGTGAFQPVPQAGWWWNPAEPGRGFMIEANAAGRLYLAADLYAEDGLPIWLSAGTAANEEAAQVGTLQSYGDGQTLTGAWRPAALQSSVGQVRLDLASASSGTLTWPGGAIPVQRFDIVANGAALGPGAFMPQTGWWYAPTEPGSGTFLEVQQGSMFLSMLLYDDLGRSVWYSSGGAMVTAALYQGRLSLVAGGQTLTGSYRPPTATVDVGAIALHFASPTEALLTLPNGRQVGLMRYAF